MKKRYLILTIICLALLISGCTTKSDKINKENYSVAIIKTPQVSESNKKTSIEYYDYDLKKVYERNYNYGGVGRTNFGLPFKEGKYVYELSVGYGEDKEDCKVLQIDKNNGNVKEYQVCKYTNNIAVDDKYVYGIYNLNGDTTVSRTEIEDNKKVETTFKGDVSTECYLYNGDLFRLTGWKNGRVFIEKAIFDKKNSMPCRIELTKYIDQETEPESYFNYKDKLYLPAKDGLLCIKDNKIKEVKLKKLNNTYPRLLRADGKYLYIAVTSIFAENDNSIIVKYNMDTDDVEKQYTVDSSIVQFDIVKNDLYILNFYDELIQYEIKGNEILKKKKIDLECDEGKYISAMYAK